jgi:Ecdysteroid kinase-like family
MFDEVITSLNQINVEWLTGVLTRSGAVERGSVESFTVDTQQRELSTNVRLKLQYAKGSSGDLPRYLFLKLVNTDMGDEFFGPSEVNYYVRDYVGVPDVPIPRCYHGAYSAALGRYHILMEDLSETHVEANTRPPTLEHGLALSEGMAATHAYWWGRQRLKEIGEAIPGADAIQRFVNIAEPGARHILASCAEHLKPHWPDAIYKLYEMHPPLMVKRTQNENGFTIIHGDTNLSNILVPIEGDRPLYIIDRQPFDWSLTVWLGVYDLAHTMVLRWDTAIRRRLEMPILKHYHDHLLKHGVRGYSWEQLLADYRLSVPMMVYVATEWCRGRLNMETFSIWMPMLQRSMTAFDDLECGDLW